MNLTTKTRRHKDTINLTSFVCGLVALCLSGSLILAVLLAAAITSSAQKPRDKSKLKDFGSSLKKLKWDPEQNQTTETTNSNAGTDTDVDVIRIDTSLVATDLLVLKSKRRTSQGFGC
jgi:hypothetical protein